MFEKVSSTLKILKIENSFLKTLYFGNIIQFFIIIFLVIAIMTLFPLKEKIPYLVHFSNAQMNFVSIKKANSEITEDELVRLSLVMSYVLNRETKNNIDDAKRHEVIRLQSDMNVWATFKALIEDDKSIYTRTGLTREVNLINYHIIPDTNIAQIDFQATVREKEKVRQQNNYRAVVEFEFTNNKLKFEDMPKNPTTYKVINYQVSKIN